MIAALNDQSGNGCAAGVASLISGVPDPFNPMSKGMSMEWKDQYKHPNWQKKRLEEFEAAEFTCQRCYDHDSQLHLHHKRYIKGRKVWEYSSGELEVLCDCCHEEAHADKEILLQLLTRLPTEVILEIAGLIAGYCSTVCGPATINVDDIASGINEPHSTALGRLAGIASRLSNIHTVIELTDAVEKAARGGVIKVVAPKPESLGKFSDWD